MSPSLTVSLIGRGTSNTLVYLVALAQQAKPLASDVRVSSSSRNLSSCGSHHHARCVWACKIISCFFCCCCHVSEVLARSLDCFCATRLIPSTMRL